MKIFILLLGQVVRYIVLTGLVYMIHRASSGESFPIGEAFVIAFTVDFVVSYLAMATKGRRISL